MKHQFIKFDRRNLEAYLPLVPAESQKCREARDGQDFHMTVIAPNEHPDAVEISISLQDVFILGLGVNAGCYYLVCHCPAGDELRRTLALSSKDFHITLGFNHADNHKVKKDATTITHFAPEAIQALCANPSKNSTKYAATLEFFAQKFADQQDVLFALAKMYANCGKFEQARAIAESIVDTVKKYRILFAVQKHLGQQLDVEVCLAELLQHSKEEKLEKSQDLDRVLTEVNASLVEKISVFDDEGFAVLDLPINFSRVAPNMWGSGIPKNKRVLAAFGIKRVFNLTEKPLPLQTHHFPTDDFGAPPDVGAIIDALLQTDAPTLVHCRAGVGRTNLVLACYLSRKMGIKPESAIHELEKSRKVRLSQVQLDTIYKFCRGPRLTCSLMMVGAPCSGKSTLCELIVRKFDNVTYVNQDKFGRKESLRMARDAKGPVLFDNCNLRAEDRAEWLGGSKRVQAVVFDLPLEKLIERLENRDEHETLTSKNRTGRKIIEQAVKQLEAPTSNEMEILKVVRNDADFSDLLHQLGVRREPWSDIIKFPRTKHLVNLGAATRDDLIVTHPEKFIGQELYVEEKVDGANLGITMDPNGVIFFQNRSHFVTPDYHAQFKKLHDWRDRHEQALRQVLRPGLILYGEWLYARHSVPYSQLPDLFMAFDLYDADTNRFATRRELETAVASTTLTLVPLLAHGAFSLEELKALVFTESKFYNGLVEGVYLRTEKGARAKIVRPDFIAGNDHWSRGPLETNKLAFH